MLIRDEKDGQCVLSGAVCVPSPASPVGFVTRIWGNGMSDRYPQNLRLLAKSAATLIIVLIVAGVVWHGVTIGTFERIWDDLVERPDAPMRFRLILQPLMAALVAIRDGLEDARTGRSPYFWTVLRDPRRRVGRLNEGLNGTARIILLAVAMDTIYQIIVLKRFYPTEAVGIAVLLAFVPYLVIRGPVTRLARQWLGSAPPH